MLSRTTFTVLIVLGLAVSVTAQINRASGLAQVHGPFWMSEGPSALEALADLNGDGRLDLLLRSKATAAYPNRMKAVLSRADGGHDQEPAALQLPAGTIRVLAGEFNGDGLADLIVETDASNPTWGRALLYCPLTGTGLASGSFLLLSPLSGPLGFVESVDLEGDGDDDLLITASDPSGHTVLLWVESQGGGAFAPRPAQFLPSGVTRLRMIAEDLDGDGIRDAAFLTPTTIERFATSGLSFFGLPPIPHGLVGLGGDTTALRAFDLEGDGDLDFVVSESAAVGFQVILDQGGTHTAGPVTVSSQPNPSTIRRCLIGVGDIDGDGLAEIVCHDRAINAWSTDYGSLEIYGDAAGLAPQILLSLPFNPASGYALATWAPRRLVDVDANGWLDLVGDAGIIFGVGLARPPVQTLSQRGSLFDVDDDGDLDLLRPGMIRRNDGSGYFESEATGVPRLPSSLPAGLDAISYVLDDGWAEADFDGDGRLDLVISADVTPAGGTVFREARLLYGRPDGRLLDTGPAASGQRIVGRANKAMLARDIDSDGDLDILVPDALWMNDGSNAFTVDALTIAGYEVVATAQFDADPGLEMLARPNFGNAIGLFVFDPPASGPPVLYQLSPSLTGGEQVADLDDDGDLDIIYLDFLLTQIIILRNQGASLAPSWGSPTGMFSLNPIHVGDFDGDQVTDFILGDRLFQNLTPGNVLGFTETGRMGYAVEQVADLDCDGDIDFIGGIVQKNRLLSGQDAGIGRQYGEGAPGSGGYRPILGFNGPLRVSSTTAAVRISNGVGATSGFLFVGLQPNDQPDVNLPSLTSYVLDTSVVATFGFSLVGAPGVPGEGRALLPFAVLPSWAGLTVFMQASFFDPGAPAFYTATNGLEMRFGN